MREATLTAVRFPEQIVLRPARGPARVLQRLDDPLVDRIQKGDPTLGWAGDARLQLYLDVPGGQWELWRLEHDNDLELVSAWSVDQYRSTEIVPAAILWLRSHDTWTGFDPFLSVVERNDKVKAAAAAAEADAMTEAADRLGHALRKDGAL